MAHPFERPAPASLPPMPPGARKMILIIVAVFFASLVVLPWIAGFATDWLWFQEIGFQTVFTTSLAWRVLLFVIGATIAFVFFYGNVRLARGPEKNFPVLYVNRGDGVSIDVSRMFAKVFLPAALVLSFLTAVAASALWMTFLKAFNAVTVGSTDPLFGRDLGYYLFKLPAISAALNTLVTLTVLALVAAASLYWMRNEITLPPKRVTATPRAALHLGGLLALLFVLVAVRLWLVATSNLLYSNTGPLTGASYTDVHVTLRGIYISAIVALLAAVWIVVGIVRGRLAQAAIAAIVIYIAVSAVARGLVPAAFQKLVVSANELTREAPYLGHHIAATRLAWGLDSVEARDLSGEATLTRADVAANAATVENVRLWERELLKQTFGQLQEIRTYYDFVNVDDDRYMIDGKYRQIHLAARELNNQSLPTRTFINERLTFTHGMGITMAPVNQVTAEGLPVLFIKDLPPVSTVSLKLTRPQIYYGELTNSHVFVGTGQREFDYPAGETNNYTNYTGKGGVPLGSFVRRVLYAWQLGSLKILLSDDIAGNARILYRRNVMERATTALPFLDFDGDPYLVLDDAGQLKWILDAYTTSASYPYSQRVANGISYMRNSVKVVIDAYDGSVDAYIAEVSDPVVRTYSQIFPGIFKPITAMPADLRRHVRYPADLFKIQSALHATYHMVEPQTFYHREDQWQIPGSVGRSTNENPFLRHMIMRLPGEQAAEYIYMTPFTPRGKDNLAAWMVARMDGENYGKLSVYRFPKQSLVYGPNQITNRINQDTEITRQIALWDQSGSKVIRGELLVIPIEESLIYVQPIYLRAEGGSIPELKRVVIAHQGRVVMAETLEEGLNTVFGSGAAGAATRSVVDTVRRGGTTTPAASSGTAPPSAALSAANAELLREAQQHYDRALAAQRAGNWADYGREIEQLGVVLRRLRAAGQ